VRVLVADDSHGPRRLLETRLTEWGYQVVACGDGVAALRILRGEDPPRLAILDWRMPGHHGPDICRELRQGTRTPYCYVILLTARDARADVIAGLDAGADDYLTKPFDFGELLARLRALVRRGARPLLPERLRFADLELDTRAHRVAKRGREISLTAREYALLEYLARRAGEVVGRAEIAEHVWDERYEPFSNVIEVYVRRLRSKLDDPGSESLIRTRRGEGYELVRSADEPS
jgi:two-component system copper resistance phosphate regulon response regulator CusR